MQIASTFASSIWMPGYAAATFRASSRKRPSVARTTLALCTTVTFVRPFCFAYSNAARTIRSEPRLVFTLQETAYASAGRSLNGANGLLVFASTADSSAGTGLNSTPAYRSSVFSRKMTRSIPSLKLSGFPV